MPEELRHDGIGGEGVVREMRSRGLADTARMMLSAMRPPLRLLPPEQPPQQGSTGLEGQQKKSLGSEWLCMAKHSVLYLSIRRTELPPSPSPLSFTLQSETHKLSPAYPLHRAPSAAGESSGSAGGTSSSRDFELEAQ